VSLTLLRVMLVLATVGGCWAVWRAFTGPVVQVELPQSRLPARPNALGRSTPAAGENLLHRAIGRPAFRVDRRPASSGYDPDRRAPSEPAPAPREPRPVLALSGIVWGADPAAVVEGVPGVEGSTVLRRGEAVGGLRLVRIAGDSVVIRGRDTTWRLTVRDPSR